MAAVHMEIAIYNIFLSLITSPLLFYSSCSQMKVDSWWREDEGQMRRPGGEEKGLGKAK